MPRWFEHTSLFHLFFQKGRMIPLRQSSGMVFLIHTMLIMYASHLIIESPPFLSSSAVMEQMPGEKINVNNYIKVLNGNVYTLHNI